MKTERHPLFLGLLGYFNGNSHFQICYRRTWRKDFIGRAVPFKEFLDHGWTKKELEEGIDAGLLALDKYRRADGSMHSVVIFTGDNLPQRTFLKRLLCGEIRYGALFKNTGWFIVNVLSGLFVMAAVALIFFYFATYLSRLQ